MNLSGWLRAEILGPGFLLVFTILVYFFRYKESRALARRADQEFRQVAAFARLRQAIGQALESGKGLHTSIGSGGVIGEQGAAGLVGISMLQVITQKSAKGDQPPLATSGDGALATLSQDTQHHAYQTAGVELQYKADQSQMTGATPFSYAAGTMLSITDQPLQASLLAGHFGPEVALIAEAAERSSQVVIGGSDGMPAQTVLLTTTDETLIGEELFAGGAYLHAGPTHTASLRAQDVLRWVIILFMIFGVILKLAGAW